MTTHGGREAVTPCTVPWQQPVSCHASSTMALVLGHEWSYVCINPQLEAASCANLFLNVVMQHMDSKIHKMHIRSSTTQLRTCLLLPMHSCSTLLSVCGTARSTQDHYATCKTCTVSAGGPHCLNGKQPLVRSNSPHTPLAALGHCSHHKSDGASSPPPASLP